MRMMMNLNSDGLFVLKMILGRHFDVGRFRSLLDWILTWLPFDPRLAGIDFDDRSVIDWIHTWPS